MGHVLLLLLKSIFIGWEVYVFIKVTFRLYIDRYFISIYG